MDAPVFLIGKMLGKCIIYIGVFTECNRNRLNSTSALLHTVTSLVLFLPAEEATSDIVFASRRTCSLIPAKALVKHLRLC